MPASSTAEPKSKTPVHAAFHALSTVGTAFSQKLNHCGRRLACGSSSWVIRLGGTGTLAELLGVVER